MNKYILPTHFSLTNKITSYGYIQGIGVDNVGVGACKSYYVERRYYFESEYLES